ncbi:MAG: hypothetical protein ACD_39C02108G0004 [uncultured bacterium]|nr:MAG: hypothetical protein ACD_39C02108G0004 [uncultured bacterium]
MKILVSYWKACLQVFPFAFVGSLLTFYFVIKGFDKNNIYQLVAASLTLAAYATLIIAIAKQKVQFELEILNAETFVAEICNFMTSVGGKVVKKSDTALLFKKRSFEISVAISANTAVFSGTRLWLAPLYEKIKNHFQAKQGK